MEVSAGMIQTAILGLAILVHAAVVSYHFGRLAAKVDGIENRLNRIEQHFFEVIQNGKK